MLLKGETNNWAGSYLLRTEVLWGVYPDRNIYIYQDMDKIYN